ncbi:MAG: protein kinase [Phycisphaeraceae bacterium]|nr:protein kinase [Phycisphaeraceae bacterium]
MRSADKFLDRFRGAAARSAYAEAINTDAWAGHGPGSQSVLVEGYTVEQLLAYGGQGAVYRAIQKGTGRLVAIKVPLADTKLRPATRYRFEREVELAARLDHPGVVRIIETCHVKDGRLGYVMEYVEGETIDRWASRARAQRAAGTRLIVSVLSEVADAIAYAHLRAVLHRDIKPSNVIVTDDGRPRVLDFGLAKSLDASGSSFATITGAFLGTIAYAAPEQIDGGGDAADIRTDVYAIGLLLFMGLTGRLPYNTDVSTAELLRQIRECEPMRPSSIVPEIAKDLDAIVLKALSKEKERRYTTAAELRDDLRAWLSGRAVRARFDSRWYVARKTLRRHRLVVASAAGVLAFLLTATGLYLGYRDQAIKAELATAIGDAQIIASHHVRMAEARAVANDNFQLGETEVWDALFDPPPVLVSNGIEGVGESGLPAVSPAYWALWDIYHRIPVVATIPDPAMQGAAFGETPGTLIAAGPQGLTWWDWTRGERTHHVELPFKPIGLNTGWGRVVVTTADKGLLTADATGRDWEHLSDSPLRMAHIGNGRMATLDAEQRVWTFWDTTKHPMTPIATLDSDSAGAPYSTRSCFDGTGRYFAVVSERGSFVIIDSQSGEKVYTKLAEIPPSITHISPRGAEAGFDAWGLDGGLRVSLNPPDRAPAVQELPRGSLPHAMEPLAARPWIGHSLYRTAYNTAGILNTDGSPHKYGRIPSFLHASADLSYDGRFVALRLRDSGRTAIFDLELEAARRLPFHSTPGARGFATIFDVAFSDDSGTLYAASIDGSVRCYETRGSGDSTILASALEGGAIRLFPSEAGVVVGGHLDANHPTRLTLLKPGGTSRLIATASRRFTSIIAGSARTILAMTDSGELVEFDLATETITRHVTLQSLTVDPKFRSLARMPDNGPLLVASLYGRIGVLDPQTLEGDWVELSNVSIRKILPHPNDPALFITAGDDGVVRVWRLDTRQMSATLIKEFGSHAGPVFSMAVHPGGQLLATAGGAAEARDVRIWDLNAGRELVGVDLFAMGVFDIEFSPDGRWLAAGGEVDPERPEEGGQLFLIDLELPDRSIAGNLEYHINRFTRERGRAPSQADALRRLFPLSASSGH